MPADVEIDSPLPGDQVGRVLPVIGTYDLGIRTSDPIPSSEVVCKFLNADGNPALNSVGDPVADQRYAITAAAGNWAVNFSLDTDYDDHRIKAQLFISSAPVDSDEVIDIDVRDVAAVDVTITTA